MARKVTTATLIVLSTAVFLNNSWAVVPQQSSRARVVARQLLVEKRLESGLLDISRPYIIKGVTWQPATMAPAEGLNPINPSETVPYGFFFDWDGRNPQGHEVFNDWLRTQPQKHYLTDIALMKQMNVNTVRVYNDFGSDPSVYNAILDEFYRNNIMVVFTVAISKADLDNGRYLPLVQNHKNHPAILMWSLGNEWNLNNFYGYGSLSEATRAINLAVQKIKAEDANHPVSSCLGDVFVKAACDSNDPCCNVNYNPWLIGDIVNACPLVDVWGINVYRGRGFGDLFNQWQSFTSKPFYLSEFGTDSFRASSYTRVNCYLADDVQGAEDQAEQASFTLTLWNEMAAHLSALDPNASCLGGLVHEFNDELWKVGSYHTGLGGLVDYNTEPESHSFDWQNKEGFYLSGAHPDNVSNEEYYGVVTAERAPKKVFAVLQELYTKLGAPVDPPKPEKPAAPSSLEAKAVSSVMIRLAWKDNSDNEVGFRIERKSGAFGRFIVIAKTRANAVSYEDSGLSPGQTYHYRIRAWNGQGHSAYSNTASATTQSLPKKPWRRWPRFWK